MSRGVLERRQWTLEVGRMKTKKDKMCNLENIRSECFLLIYIYIYKGIFCELKFSGYGYPQVRIL